MNGNCCKCGKVVDNKNIGNTEKIILCNKCKMKNRIYRFVISFVLCCIVNAPVFIILYSSLGNKAIRMVFGIISIILMIRLIRPIIKYVEEKFPLV